MRNNGLSVAWQANYGAWYLPVKDWKDAKSDGAKGGGGKGAGKRRGGEEDEDVASLLEKVRPPVVSLLGKVGTVSRPSWGPLAPCRVPCGRGSAPCHVLAGEAWTVCRVLGEGGRMRRMLRPFWRRLPPPTRERWSLVIAVKKQISSQYTPPHMRMAQGTFLNRDWILFFQCVPGMVALPPDVRGG